MKDKKMLPPLTFVIGGAASGKSVVAEKLILDSGLSPIYVATSRIFDDEMKSKVEVHRNRRDATWQTVNAEIDLAPALGNCSPDSAVLIDCATMWLSNVVLDELDVEAHQIAFTQAIANCAAPVVVVSNEVGQGIVPDNALARRFREAQGRLNIALAAQSDCAIQVVAGLSNVLKGTVS